ncbi:MAG: alpha/beta fold hydrolase [Planctomycetota bacterium]|nr:alpha/beta fold hydrolase [Planctomycetota bacterium]
MSRGPAPKVRAGRRRRWLALGLGGCLFAGLGFSWLAGGRLVAPNPRSFGLPPAWSQPDRAVEELALESASGATLSGWFLPVEEPCGVAVLLHPKEGDRRAMLGRAELLAGAGYACVLVDLQAHGKSPGERVTLGHLEREDARAAVAFAKARQPGLPVVVIGWSLGGAAAVLAGPLGIDALVIEQVFASIEEAVSDRFDHHMGGWARLLTPLLTVQVPLRLGVSVDELRPVERIGAAGCPVLVLGGGADPYSPPAATRALFEAAAQPKAMALFEGAGHVDLQRADPARYERELLGFLEGHLGSDPWP